MSKATIKQFIEFALSQPANKLIDHSDGWNLCSVGEFTKIVVLYREPKEVAHELRQNEMMMQGITGKAILAYTVEHSLVHHLSTWSTSRPTTYGELVEKAKTYPHLKEFF